MNAKYVAYGFLVALALLFLGAGIGLYYHYVTIKSKTETTALQEAGQELDRSADQLYDYLTSLQLLLQKTAERIDINQFTQEQLTNLLQDTLRGQLNFESIAVAFQPFAFDKNKRLFSIVIDKKGNDLVTLSLPYDYTQTTIDAKAHTEWYTQTIVQGQQWLEPYFGKALKKQVITYSTPIFSPTDRQHTTPIGVLSALITPTILRTTVNSLASTSAGFGIILSKSGVLIVHPNEDYTINGKDLTQIAREQNNKSLRAIIPTILTTPTGTVFYTESITNKRAALLYRAISGTSLILGSVIPSAELLARYTDTFRKIQILVILFVTLALITGIIILFSTILTSRTLMLISISISCILTASIIALCYTEKNYLHLGSESAVLITRQSTIDKLANEMEQQTSTTINQIKTGILINNIEYVTNQQIRLTGYLWQYYPNTLPTTITRDFLLPDCVEHCTKKILKHEKRQDEEFILWFFTGKFNQTHFNLNNFPFDEQTISLAISHPAPTYDLFIVPDLTAYPLVAPRNLPGIASSVIINSRSLLESYFLFKKPTENMNRQLVHEKTLQHPQHHLYFTIISQRNLIHILILYLLPLLLALIFLHIGIAISTRYKSHFLESISIASSMFLTLTMLHSALRKEIGISGICYLEYYYILLYITICFILANALLHNNKSIFARIITYQKNRWTLALITPSYLFIMFIITAISFYK